MARMTSFFLFFFFFQTTDRRLTLVSGFLNFTPHAPGNCAARVERRTEIVD